MKIFSREDVRRMEVDKDIEGLIQALEYGDKFAASDAAHALEKIGNERAIESLIQALKNANSHPIVRRAAAGALAKIKDERAIEPLVEAFYNDSEVRKNAVWALRDIGQPAVEPLIRALKDENRDIREDAADALGKMGEPAVDPLILVFTNDINFPVVRRAAAQALVRTNDARIVEPLLHALKDEDPKIRGTASWALGRIKEVKAVEALIQLLKDRDSDVRKWTIYALEQIGNADAIDPLLQVLKNEDEGGDIRKSAKKAIEGLQKNKEEKISLKEIEIPSEEKKESGKEIEERRLKEELKEKIKKLEGWKPVGLHCPMCKSMDMRHKTVNIIGFLFIKPVEIPDTLMKCFSCNYTAAYKGSTKIMELTSKQATTPVRKASKSQQAPEKKMIKSIIGVADTIETAFEEAQSKLPTDVDIIEKKKKIVPVRKVVTIESFDEKSARVQLKQEIDKTAKIESITLKKQGKKGFLGIGKKPDCYEVHVFERAVVEIKYKNRSN